MQQTNKQKKQAWKRYVCYFYCLFPARKTLSWPIQTQYPQHILPFLQIVHFEMGLFEQLTDQTDWEKPIKWWICVRIVYATFRPYHWNTLNTQNVSILILIVWSTETQVIIAENNGTKWIFTDWILIRFRSGIYWKCQASLIKTLNVHYTNNTCAIF